MTQTDTPVDVILISWSQEVKQHEKLLGTDKSNMIVPKAEIMNFMGLAGVNKSGQEGKHSHMMHISCIFDVKGDKVQIRVYMISERGYTNG